MLRVTCSVRGTCGPAWGPKCLLVCMYPDTLSCSGSHVLCKRCSWTHSGPEQPPRCPKAFVYVAGVLVGPSGPRVTPLPLFVCVPEEFVGPSGPRTPQARPICMCALAGLVCACVYASMFALCMRVCMFVYACVHVVCALCMCLCMYACCVCVGARWSFVDPGSPVVCWAS